MAINYVSLLNEKQYEAVTTQHQNVRIIAGAGSGKTRVLTYRIAYLIEQMHVDPSRILAVTFTNKAAQEMKNRVCQLVPNVSTFLQVSTFHSFCARFLRQEAHWVDYPVGFTIFDEDDQLRLIKSIAEEKGLKKTDPLVKQAVHYIGVQKTKGRYPEDINIRNDIYDNEKDLLEFYEIYESKKRAMFAFDFDDLILVCIAILKQVPEVKERWQRKFTHVLVDEYQDTNDVQYTLMQLLITPATSVYVVGDPDQTIYTWRGANQRIIMRFNEDFHDVIDIVLNQNYRSTGNILDVANKLIRHNKLRLEKDLFTASESGAPIVAKRFSSADEEAHWVVQTIQRIHRLEGEYTKIALLYRSSYLTRPFEAEFAMKGIPYRIFGGLRFYQRKEVKDVLAYFRLITNPLDNVSFERIANAPRRGIGDTTLRKIAEAALAEGVSEYELIANIERYPGHDIPSKAIAALTLMISKIEETKQKLAENLETYGSVLRAFIEDIGYYAYIAEEEEPDENRAGNVNALFDDINNYIQREPESNFEEYLQNISLLTAQDDMNGGNYVSLMTIHCAKGLEYDYVFIIGMTEGSMPSSRSVNERDDGLEEERRLAYVAMTRAKKELYLTCNSGYSYVTDSRAIPSRFFKEAGVKIPDDESERSPYRGGYGSSYGGNRNSRGSRGDFRVKWGGNFSHPSGSSDFFGDGDAIMPFDEPPKKKPEPKQQNNGISDWKIGDVCMHEKFGRGVVTEVMDGNIIVIKFDSEGKKTLLGSHKMLSRLHSGGGEA